jgi:hypothetical protein
MIICDYKYIIISSFTHAYKYVYTYSYVHVYVNIDMNPGIQEHSRNSYPNMCIGKYEYMYINTKLCIPRILQEDIWEVVIFHVYGYELVNF